MTRSAKGRSAARLILSLVAAASLAVSATACGGSGGSSATGDGTPQSGGSLTVLLDSGFAGAWATGLDPATSNTTGSNLAQNAAVFGGLFTLVADDDGGNARIEPNQAESYSWSDDDKTLTITLRSGIEFSDGTPFNAEAVLWNWIRELNSGSAGLVQLDLDTSGTAPTYSDEFMQSLWDALPADVDQSAVEADLTAIKAVDDLTLTIALNAPNGSLIDGFPVANLNLIASPTAYAELGADAFSLTPVGAGPFVISSDSLSDKLVLTKNTNYFKDGLPYLDSLTFQSVAGDQVAYQTLLSGQADAIEGVNTVSLIQQAQQNSELSVLLTPATSPYVIQLNTNAAPFDDIRAREAIYYATDFDAINTGLFNGDGEASQTFMTSSDLFDTTTVDGYRSYDLDKAKELVAELGGLTVTLGTTDTGMAPTVMTALQTQWEEAGITVTTDAQALGDVITTFIGGQWQAMLQTAGSWDPSVGIGVAVRFGSTSPYSGTPTAAGDLDALLAEAVATTDSDARQQVYDEIAQYISDQAYAPFGFAFSPAQIVRQGVHGPGLTTAIPALSVNCGVLYDQVWVDGGGQ
ncbi:MAG: ABC transporter substrate-binding protein [Microbacterium sp.]